MPALDSADFAGRNMYQVMGVKVSVRLVLEDGDADVDAPMAVKRLTYVTNEPRAFALAFSLTP